MVSVELPSIKNAVLRKKRAAEFIGSLRMEALGDSLSKRLMGVKNGPSGVVALHDCDEGVRGRDARQS